MRAVGVSTPSRSNRQARMPAGSPRVAVSAAAGIVSDRMIVERRVVMATKADFTDQEWKAMQKGVTGAGMLVSISDRDFTDTFGEAGALAKYLGEEHEKSGSELIRELASTHGSGFGLTASPQKVEEETLASLRWSSASPSGSLRRRAASRRARRLRSRRSSRRSNPVESRYFSGDAAAAIEDP